MSLLRLRACTLGLAAVVTIGAAIPAGADPVDDVLDTTDNVDNSIENAIEGAGVEIDGDLDVNNAKCDAVPDSLGWVSGQVGRTLKATGHYRCDDVQDAIQVRVQIQMKEKGVWDDYSPGTTSPLTFDTNYVDEEDEFPCLTGKTRKYRVKVVGSAIPDGNERKKGLAQSFSCNRFALAGERP